MSTEPVPTEGAPAHASSAALVSPTVDGAGLPGTLQRDLVLLALVAAAARFVPVPLLDDVVKTQANKGAVSRTVTESGAGLNVSLMGPLYDTGSIIGFLVSLPLKVVLYPLRKIVSVISAVHGVPTDLLETFLLGRSLFRALNSGAAFSAHDHREQPTKKAMKKEAKRVRSAFDKAFKGTNFKVVSSGLGDALSQVKNLGALVTDLAAQVMPTREEPTSAIDDEGSLADRVHDDDVAESLEDVEEVLSRAEVIKELEAFDARFDEALAAST